MHPGVALLLHPAARIAVTDFTVHPSTVIGLAGLGALYHWRARQGPAEGVDASPTTTQRATFYGALALIFLSLNGWLHDLSDTYLFSAHMVQHLVLTLLVPPLLLAGLTGDLLRPALRVPAVRALAAFFTRPGVCFMLFNVVLTAWHLPPMYELAMRHHPVHIVQHLCFMTASVLMWWPIISPLRELPRLSYPGQMLYLFLLSIPMSLVAVCIGYADHLLYPSYATAARIWGITPMQDQMIGALIMWIPGGLFFFAIISVVFFKWQQVGGDETRAGAQVRG